MNQPKKKKQSFIRWNAIIPFVIVVILTSIYFTLFFDTHIKNAMEWIGYKALGTEVNIGQFKSSFTEGKVEISKIEITNSEKPQLNSIELSQIRFNLNWDALLRAKFVIEEIAVEGIQFMSKRAKPGQVAPPPPPEPDKESFTDLLAQKSLNKLATDQDNNVLGDVATFLKTGKSDEQVKSLEGQLKSKTLLSEMNTKWASKQKEWQTNFKTLPTNEQINTLNEKFKAVKLSDFKTLDELNASVNQIKSLLDEANTHTTKVQSLKNQFDTDMKSLDQDYKNIDQQIKTDIDALKSHFKIPKIDAGSFAKTLFMGYLTPYTRQLDTYKQMAQKYLPPKYTKMLDGEKEASKPDETIQPHVRTSGVTYEFPVKKGYPLFWIQNINISSKSSTNADYGDFKGSIKNITSNQKQIGSPTTINIDGDFNNLKISGIHIASVIDNTKDESVIKFNFNIQNYPLTDLELLKSDTGSISIPLTNSSLRSGGTIIGLQKFDLSLNNVFANVKFQTSAQDKTVDEILKTAVRSISKFDLEASIKGELQSLKVDINSSLATDLEKSFSNLLQSKIKEANEKLEKSVNAEIGKLKSQLDEQVAALRNQADSEIKKVQSQIEEQKKIADTKIAQAKKDFEDQNKKKLLQEGQKKVDELKKKFGL